MKKIFFVFIIVVVFNSIFFPFSLWSRYVKDVFIISVDTLRRDFVGIYNDKVVYTPNIDKLLRNSLFFSNARTVEPLTAPSFASLFTGVYPHEHGVTRNGIRFSEQIDSLPKVLSKVGYTTVAVISNWVLNSRISGFDKHFDFYLEPFSTNRWIVGFKESSAEIITNRSIQFLKNRQELEPIFMWIHYSDPHAPYRYKGYLPALKKFAFPRDARGRYASEVAFTDFYIGKLLEFLRNGRKNSCTVFVVDHGENLGEHNYWGHGRHLWEESLRIPMGINCQGVVDSSVIDHFALILDIPNTLLGILGAKGKVLGHGINWWEVVSYKGGRNPRKVTLYQAHKGAVQRKSKSTIRRARIKGLLELGIIDSEGTKIVYRIKDKKIRVVNLNKEKESNIYKRLDDMKDRIYPYLREVIRDLAAFDESSPPPLLDEENYRVLETLGYVD